MENLVCRHQRVAGTDARHGYMPCDIGGGTRLRLRLRLRLRALTTPVPAAGSGDRSQGCVYTLSDFNHIGADKEKRSGRIVGSRERRRSASPVKTSGRRGLVWESRSKSHKAERNDKHSGGLPPRGRAGPSVPWCDSAKAGCRMPRQAVAHGH